MVVIETIYSHSNQYVANNVNLVKLCLQCPCIKDYLKWLLYNSM